MAGKDQREEAGEDQEIGITQKEGDVILTGPAVFTNKVYATSLPDGIRITFAEYRGDETLPVFRSAVFMVWSDFVSFMKLMRRVEERLQVVKVAGPSGEDQGGQD